MIILLKCAVCGVFEWYMPAALIYLLSIHIEINPMLKYYASVVTNILDDVLMLLLPSSEDDIQSIIHFEGMIPYQVACYKVCVWTAFES